MKKLFLTLLAGIVALTSCNAQTTKNNDKMVNERMKKCLVVFFSHAGDNYSVGNIQVGNTKIVAGYISELTGADQLEIVTHKYDGMAYKPLCDLAQEEQMNDERPAFEPLITSSNGEAIKPSNVKDFFAGYDVIFVGGPVWWGTFDTYDLNGKILYPFTTHEGSGLGSCVSDLRKAYPNADVRKGFSIYGHEVRTNKAKVENWIKGLEL